MPRDPRRIRVCMLPRDNQTNESLGLMSDALERTGRVEVVKFRYLVSLFIRADIFHVHWVDELVAGTRWPKHLIKVYLFLMYIFVRRFFKRPIVWTVHNVGAYEKNYPALERSLWRIFLPRVDWAIHLCSASLDAVYRLTPAPPPGSVIPHPHYRAVYHSRETYAGGPFTFTSFGLIRPYKGFERLIRVFRSSEIEGAVLRISGAVAVTESRQLVGEMIKLSQGDHRITLDFRELSRREVEDLVSESNVMVLPYHKIMNSGVAALALSLGRPILGPAGGCILDYYDKLGPEWVLMYDSELTARDLKIAFERFRKRPERPADLSWMEPDRIAAQILDVYERVLKTPRP